MSMLRLRLVLSFALLSTATVAVGQDPRLEKFFGQNPKADLDGDGTLTLEEAREFRKKSRSEAKPKARMSNPAKRSTPSQLAERYEPRELSGLLYRFFAPEIESGKRYPLVLTLHGAGGKGDDNVKNLKHYNGILSSPELQAKYPCFVVAPQTKAAWRVKGAVPDDVTSAGDTAYSKAWNAFVGGRRTFSIDHPDSKLGLVFKLLDQLADQLPIDPDRVYVLGHSMGGFGTFEALAVQPKRFAAAIPSAGGLPPWHDPAVFKHVPVWAFHGEKDPTVPIVFTEEIFRRIQSAGGNMKFTTLGGVGHGASEFAFDYDGDRADRGFKTELTGPQCDATERIWDWLFAQKRNRSQRRIPEMFRER